MEIIVLLGAPGSGKGTAAAHLGQASGARHVSTGEMCREAMAQGSPWGEAIRPYMDRGELVPDALALERIEEWLKAAPPYTWVLFDGFPRTVGQAEVFEESLAANAWRLAHVVLLDVETSTLEERLGARMGCQACGTIYNLLTRPPAREGTCDTCGAGLSRRDDDRMATVRRRLAIYEERTAPLIAFYEERGLLRRINAENTAEEVVLQIRNILDSDEKKHDKD